MITSTTSSIPRKGILLNINGFDEYLKRQSSRIKDVYGKASEEFSDTDSYSLITEGKHNSLQTYFYFINCKNKLLCVETDKKSGNDFKIIDVCYTELTDSTVEQMKKCCATNEKVSVSFV